MPIGSGDIFLLKLDANGLFVWAHTFGGDAPDIGSSICIDNLDNIYFAGNFQGAADFDPGTSVFSHTSLDGRDAFMTMLDKNANLIWALTIGGTYDQSANSIFVTQNGNEVYTTGQFRNSCDFDTGSGTDIITATNTFDDCFIHKLAKDLTEIDTKTIIKPFVICPNPAHSDIILQSNIEEFSNISIYNSLGEIVYDINAFSKTISVDISNQPAGIYYVKATYKNQSIIEKILIE